MKGEYFIDKILPDKEVQYIQKLLNGSNNCDWLNGLLSTTYGEEYDDINSYTVEEIKRGQVLKKNYELDMEIELYSIINQIINGQLKINENFVKNLIPHKTTSPIISKMNSGCYYRTHLDNSILKQYSTTLFLSDPESYDGGALRLKLFNGIQEFKLKPGYSITYETGITHEVTEVTNGTRYVAVFWTQSFIKDKFIRSILSDIYEVRSMLSEGKSVVHPNIESSIEDPIHLLDEIFDNLHRQYGTDIEM